MATENGDGIDELAAAVRDGDRAALPRAITLVESTRADHRDQAQQLLLALMPAAGNALHVGITGVPGVGKSTAIEALGMHLIGRGHRVAVLAVDPSSTRTGGSILGDKTRMPQLAAHPDAYIRPSPTSGTLGGVARATRETIVLLEAAGFDVILVETVGVGQSEVAVANMVDTFVFLTLARTGDQLQGIKKGVLELADIVVVNKADGDHLNEARKAARELAGAIRLIYPRETLWRPPVLTMSALEGTGLEELWETVERHRQVLSDAGEFEARRRAQQVDWTWQMVRDTVLDRVLSNPAVRKGRADVERQVLTGELTPALAAQQIFEARVDNGRVNFKFFARCNGRFDGMTLEVVGNRRSVLPRGVHGAADPHFACAVRSFASMFPGRRFGGGALAVYLDGEPVVDVWTGWSDRRGRVPWTADTATMVFSATKGMASTVIHRLVDRGLIDYDAPVAEYWPAFGANGKSRHHCPPGDAAPGRSLGAARRQQGRPAESRTDGRAPGGCAPRATRSADPRITR